MVAPLWIPAEASQIEQAKRLHAHPCRGLDRAGERGDSWEVGGGCGAGERHPHLDRQLLRGVADGARGDAADVDVLPAEVNRVVVRQLGHVHGAADVIGGELARDGLALGEDRAAVGGRDLPHRRRGEQQAPRDLAAPLTRGDSLNTEGPIKLEVELIASEAQRRVAELLDVGVGAQQPALASSEMRRATQTSRQSVAAACRRRACSPCTAWPLPLRTPKKNLLTSSK